MAGAPPRQSRPQVTTTGPILDPLELVGPFPGGSGGRGGWSLRRAGLLTARVTVPRTCLVQSLQQSTFSVYYYC